MTQTLQGRRVLVVEDEYFLAHDLREALEQAGATVVGPIPDVPGALAMLDADDRIDAALLDVNLGGVHIFPVVDALIARGVPIAFATGYDRAALPEQFSNIPRLEKPVKLSDVIAVLQPLTQS